MDMVAEPFRLSQALHAALSPWGVVSDELLRELEPLFEARQYSGGQFLAMPGKAFDRVLVVARGVLRFFILDEEGREWNKGFAAEGRLTGPLAETHMSWPDPYGMQAIEDSVVFEAPAATFSALAAGNAVLDGMVKRYVGALLRMKADRLTGFQRLDATGRYRDFLERYPELAGRLPQYHIASYLGISEVSLSRLRRKVAGNLS
ncbi:Crp/Fnr family transcriptional regulator [Mangrovitalea sediminis]|uniref:Crp/Fnr family transcriptional regulator n=1 Tax=Mangrovitalea sediminis TaxID=1982043 RepID=UPI000BE57D36|nr:Crp/Fnr family transcriptional regulator [Mangrovitalea sediminis]